MVALHNFRVLHGFMFEMMFRVNDNVKPPQCVGDIFLQIILIFINIEFSKWSLSFLMYEIRNELRK